MNEREGDGIERRRFARLVKPTPVKIKIGRSAGAQEATAGNLGERGVFIEMDLEEDVLFWLRSRRQRSFLIITLPEHTVEVRAIAKVAWWREYEGPKERKCGIGMKFIRIEPEEKRKLASYVLEMIKLREKRRAEEQVIKVSMLVNQSKEKVYSLLKDIGRFPSFISNVKQLKIIERSAPNRVITEWEVEVDGAIVIWKEEDIFDDDRMIITFRMLEGDYNRYEGEWDLNETSSGTRISLSVNIDWGAPSLVKFVRHILERKTKRSLKGMLMAVKRETERRST